MSSPDASTSNQMHSTMPQLNVGGMTSARVRSRTLRVAAAVALLALLAGGASFLTQLPAAQETALQAKALPVSVKPLEELTSYTVNRSYTGVLQSRRSSELGFQRGGEIVSLNADEGDTVIVGQVLARLDARNLAAQEEQLVAQVKQAEAVLAELVQGPRKEQIDAARAVVERASSELSQAKATYNRTAGLWKTNSVSRQEYDDSLFLLNAAQAAVQAATERWRELESGTRKEQIDAQQAMVDQLNANLKSTRLDIENSELKAPYEGRISARYVDEGAVQAAGQPLLRLVEAGHLEARIGLPPEVANRYQPNDVVKLQTSIGTIDCQVKAIIPEVDPQTRTQTLVASLPEQCPLVPSMMVRMLAQEQIQREGFWVPSSALTNGTRGLWSVYVAHKTDGGYVVEARSVETLEAGTDKAFVRGTLSDGELLITTGLQRLSCGQFVDPQPYDAADASMELSLPIEAAVSSH